MFDKKESIYVEILKKNENCGFVGLKLFTVKSVNTPVSWKLRHEICLQITICILKEVFKKPDDDNNLLF